MNLRVLFLIGVTLLSACAARGPERAQQATAAVAAAQPLPADVDGSTPVGQLLGALHDVKTADTARCEQLAQGFTDALGVSYSGLQAWSFSDLIVPALANMNRAAKAHQIQDYGEWDGELDMAAQVEAAQDYSLIDATGDDIIKIISQIGHPRSVTDLWLYMQAAEPHKVLCAWEREIPAPYVDGLSSPDESEEY